MVLLMIMPTWSVVYCTCLRPVKRRYGLNVCGNYRSKWTTVLGHWKRRLLHCHPSWPWYPNQDEGRLGRQELEDLSMALGDHTNLKLAKEAAGFIRHTSTTRREEYSSRTLTETVQDEESTIIIICDIIVHNVINLQGWNDGQLCKLFAMWLLEHMHII